MGMIRRVSGSRLSRAARADDKGAFLADAAHGFTPSSSVAVRFEPADERTAEVLRIEPGDEVTVRDRVMLADDVPVQLAVSRLPREFTRGTQIEQGDTGLGGTYARLEDAGHIIGWYAEHVRSRMPAPGEASALHLAEDVPLLVVSRVAYRQDGVPLELNEMVLRSDRYELTYQWPAD